MNVVVITGNLVRNPDLAHTSSGHEVCNFTVAVNRPFKKDITDFFDCTAWGHIATYLGKYGTKGQQIAVHGFMVQRHYQTKDGQKRHRVEIMCSEVSLLTKNQILEAKAEVEKLAPPIATYGSSDFSPADDLDDLPF